MSAIVPPDVASARGHIFLCDLYRRERMALAREWVRKGRPAMAHHAVQRAREWNQKHRMLVRQLRAG